MVGWGVKGVMLSRLMTLCDVINLVKVKQSLYKLGQTLRVPGG
jgi:hypothetical protein